MKNIENQSLYEQWKARKASEEISDNPKAIIPFPSFGNLPDGNSLPSFDNISVSPEGKLVRTTPPPEFVNSLSDPRLQFFAYASQDVPWDRGSFSHDFLQPIQFDRYFSSQGMLEEGYVELDTLQKNYSFILKQGVTYKITSWIKINATCLSTSMVGIIHNDSFDSFQIPSILNVPIEKRNQAADFIFTTQNISYVSSILPSEVICGIQSLENDITIHRTLAGSVLSITPIGTFDSPITYTEGQLT